MVTSGICWLGVLISSGTNDWLMQRDDAGDLTMNKCFYCLYNLPDDEFNVGMVLLAPNKDKNLSAVLRFQKNVFERHDLQAFDENDDDIKGICESIDEYMDSHYSARKRTNWKTIELDRNNIPVDVSNGIM